MPGATKKIYQRLDITSDVLQQSFESITSKKDKFALYEMLTSLIPILKGNVYFTNNHEELIKQVPRIEDKLTCMTLETQSNSNQVNINVMLLENTSNGVTVNLLESISFTPNASELVQTTITELLNRHDLHRTLPTSIRSAADEQSSKSSNAKEAPLKKNRLR